ncbi:MAG: methyltransferase [Hyphomicrobiaceae bacterium]|nr:methyltransferase [Hyphomicrobiaceae bacterium]
MAGAAAGIIFAIGLVVAGLLVALLLATLVWPPLRIWPTPGERSWQSFVFWPLFRGLNGLAVLSAVTTWPGGAVGLPVWLRGLAALLLAASVAVFVYAFRVLGRDNSYGATEGLVTAGIYQWSRNPQNAMLILVYAALAVAADSGPTYVLAGATVLVYWLMVLLEEPWLAAKYGVAYEAYCASVPRLFNWRRLLGSR